MQNNRRKEPPKEDQSELCQEILMQKLTDALMPKGSPETVMSEEDEVDHFGASGRAMLHVRFNTMYHN